MIGSTKAGIVVLLVIICFASSGAHADGRQPATRPAEGAPVVGRVIDKDGHPVVGVRVIAEPVDGVSNHAETRFSDAHGEFRFGSLRQTSMLRARDGSRATTEATRVAPGDRNVVLLLKESAPASFRVTVELPDGRPAGDARVGLIRWTGGKYGWERVDDEARTNADGEFVFQNLEADRRYSWRVQLAGFGDARGEASPLRAGKETRGDAVRLIREDRPIKGRVRDKSGKALGGVEVAISGRSGHQTTTTDEDGGFAFLVVPGARVIIDARVGDEALGTKRVSAGDEEVDLTVDLPAK